MNVAVRPYATAGVALLGASVIAMSPLAPPAPATQAIQRTLSSVGVELSASVNPIDNWKQVFETTAANLGALGQQIVDSPAPILSQIVANQIASLKTLQSALNNSAANLKQTFDSIPATIKTATAQLQSGDITGAADTLNNNVVLPLALTLVTVASDSTVPLVNTVNNFAKAFATLPNTVYQVILPMTFPLLSTINVVVQATQDVYDGVVASDPGAVVNTLVNLPANLVGGFLNGSGQILGIIPTPGLLTPYQDGYGFLGSGPIASLIQLRDVIAQAIGATPPSSTAATSAAAAVPTAAKTVTLSTAAPKVRGTASTARAAITAVSESAAESTATDATAAGATETTSGSTGSTATGAKATAARSATDSASGDHGSKAGAGKKGSAAKSGRSARAGK